MSDYDCLVLGAFIDVMEKPLKTLKKILSVSKKYVIVHRQHLGKGTKSWLTTSYNGMISYQSQLDTDDLVLASKEAGFSVTKIIPVDGQYSILLEKK